MATCGQGTGYCIHGADCTLNEDFFADDEGHCDGLRTAFTPQTHFSCCRYVNKNSTLNIEELTLPPTSTIDGDFDTSTQPVQELTTKGQGPPRVPGTGYLDTQNEIDDDRMARTEDLSALPEFPETALIDQSRFNCSPKWEIGNSGPGPAAKNRLVAQNGAQPRKMNTENPGELDDGAVLVAPVQRFLVARNLFADVESRDLDGSRDGNDEAEAFPVRLTLPDELRSNSATLKDKFGKNKCLNLTDEADNARRCVNVWKFVSNNTIICFGTLINSVWLLTSASCITR